MSFTQCEMNNTPWDKKGLALKNGHTLRQKRVGAGCYVGVVVGKFSSESQQAWPLAKAFLKQYCNERNPASWLVDEINKPN
jgi:hydroxyethylthiazole kinase-like sugar kinase family protein